MAWTDPETFTAGQTLTAASMNIISGNLSALGGAWTSFTPSWTNLTVGTGGSPVNEGAYLNVGKTYIVRFYVALGSSGFSVGDPYMTLPNSSSFASSPAYSVAQNFGMVHLTDTGTNAWLAAIGPQSSTQTRFRLWRSDGTYVSVSTISSTVPFTWGAGDTIAGQFIYEAA